MQCNSRLYQPFLTISSSTSNIIRVDCDHIEVVGKLQPVVRTLVVDEDEHIQHCDHHQTHVHNFSVGDHGTIQLQFECWNQVKIMHCSKSCQYIL